MSAHQKRDYYEVLGIARDAEGEEIKRAYKRLAIEYHPDRNPEDARAEERFKEASEAYAVLSDPEKRVRYDRMGHAAFESTGPGGFENVDFGSVSDILEGLFGEMFGNRRRRPRGGRDLTYELEVTFEEAALGCDKSISLRRPTRCEDCGGTGAAGGSEPEPCTVCKGRGEVRPQRGFFASPKPCQTCSGTGSRIDDPCDTCRGKGTTVREEELVVRVPAGVHSGAVRTLRGAGEVGAGGSGDLHVTVRVQAHPLFSRDRADVLCTVPISFPQAVLGATVEVPTLDGKVQMKVPAGTQSGRIFRLRGKGIPVYGGYGKGDQLVTILVEVPEKLSRKQRTLVEELAEEMGVDTHPQQKTFLDRLRALFE